MSPFRHHVACILAKVLNFSVNDLESLTSSLIARTPNLDFGVLSSTRPDRNQHSEFSQVLDLLHASDDSPKDFIRALVFRLSVIDPKDFIRALVFRLSVIDQEHGAFWRKEFKLIRSSLETVFGSEASGAMLKAWSVDETIPKLLAVDPDPTQGGKPVGHDKIGRGQMFIEELVKVSKEGNNNEMENALDQVPPNCTWVHLPVYRCLALACSRDDGEDVRESLLKYAKDMIESKQWDPAVLLSASRAAQVQGWSSSTRHILLALYQVLFPKQAMAFMSRDDHLFWEKISGISDSESGHAEPTLLSEKAVASKKQGVEDEWASLKREFKIQSASMDELMKLTGIQQVKLEAMKTVQKLLLDQQFKKQQRVVTTCNFAFMGNPGTGMHMMLECPC
jgi:hypothetical protein